MSTNLIEDEILVFKTDITSSQAIEKLAPAINNLAGIVKWNVDLHDCDNILRVVCRMNISPAVINILQEYGHKGEELI